jgi:hypothetical protein
MHHVILGAIANDRVDERVAAAAAQRAARGSDGPGRAPLTALRRRRFRGRLAAGLLGLRPFVR